MAAVSHLNVNYCCDTQDNLTCFSNLFFLVIRCSNWKIFQNVTTLPKVKWQGKGAFPEHLHYKSRAGYSTGHHLDEPSQGSEMLLLESSRGHPYPLRVKWVKRKAKPQQTIYTKSMDDKTWRNPGMILHSAILNPLPWELFTHRSKTL